MPDHAVSGSYHVSVNAPGEAPAPPREWLVRAFNIAVAGRGELLASCSHENLEVAADHVFREIRADIDESLRRAGLALAVDDASHDGAGGDEHRAAASGEGLTPFQTVAWCERIDELLAARPDVNAHQLRNVAGEFAFSPASCPLCRALADIEVQARAEILAQPAGARA